MKGVRSSAGGLRRIHRAAPGKTTFYNNLRVYDSTVSSWKRPKSTGGYRKPDPFVTSQSFCNDKYVRESSLIKNY